jgi:hypothetical protein
MRINKISKRRNKTIFDAIIENENKMYALARRLRNLSHRINSDNSEAQQILEKHMREVKERIF